jgi:cytosine/uracil/thiamine/allantoin permease
LRTRDALLQALLHATRLLGREMQQWLERHTSQAVSLAMLYMFLLLFLLLLLLHIQHYEDTQSNICIYICMYGYITV